jgi:hypothetical protein
MSQVRKLYLDSRLAEGSGSDISFELPRQIPTRKGDAIALTGAGFSNVFQTIMAGFNDVLYYWTSGQNPQYPDHSQISTGQWLCAYQLTPGQYTGEALGAEIKRVLTLSGHGDPNPSVTYDSTTGKYTIALSNTSTDLRYSIGIFAQSQLESAAWQRDVWYNLFDDWLVRGPGSVNFNPLNSANSLLNCPPAFFAYMPQGRQVTGVLNLAPIRELYIRSRTSAT